MHQNSAKSTISSMLEGLTFGEDFLHEPPIQGQTESNYFRVDIDLDQPKEIPVWVNPPSPEQYPRRPRRKSLAIRCSEIPLLDRSLEANGGKLQVGAHGVDLLEPILPSDVPPPVFRVHDSQNALSDFFPFAGDNAFLLSDRLKNLIEAHDPGSIDCVLAQIEGCENPGKYWFVAPTRHLEAVDTSKTIVSIVHKQFGDVVFRRINVLEGAAFDSRTTGVVPSFNDVDLSGWFWSRALVEAAIVNEITGMVFKRAGFLNGERMQFS